MLLRLQVVECDEGARWGAADDDAGPGTRSRLPRARMLFNANADGIAAAPAKTTRRHGRFQP